MSREPKGIKESKGAKGAGEGTGTGEETRFEDALERLEGIVATMEGGDLPLDDSLKMFEEGVGLYRLCSKKLDDAERRVEILMKTSEGGVEATPFSGPENRNTP